MGELSRPREQSLLAPSGSGQNDVSNKCRYRSYSASKAAIILGFMINKYWCVHLLQAALGTAQSESLC